MLHLTRIRRFVLMQIETTTTTTTTIAGGGRLCTPSWTEQRQLGLFSGLRDVTGFFSLPT